LAALSPHAAAIALAALVAAACTSSSNTLTVAGTVEIREVRLSPLAAGRLSRLLKDEGDSVHAGDTVAVLVQPGLSAQIEQRRALADAATTRTADIRAAEADSQRIANDLARARVLAAQGIASPQELERLQAAAAAAVAFLIRRELPATHRFLFAVVVLGAFGLVYGGLTLALRVPESRALLARVSRRQ